MSKSLFTAIACALLLSAGLAFTACKKEGLNGGGGTYTLKGRILRDCSGTPIAGAKLRVSFSSGSVLNPEYDASAGSGTTAADGTFQIECENHGSGLISLHSDAGNTGVNWVNDYEIANTEDATLDFGTLYETFQLTLLVKFTATSLSLNDTLYFGEYKTRSWDTVVGLNGSIVFASTSESFGDRPPYQGVRRLAWGIGLSDYHRAIDSLESSSNSGVNYHVVASKLNICDERDTTNVLVP